MWPSSKCTTNQYPARQLGTRHKFSDTLLILPFWAFVNDINAEEILIVSTALQYFFRFITADLAHRRSHMC